MPQRVSSNTTYTLPLYRGITYSKTFTYQDSAGVGINLTGKEIQVKVKDVFPALLSIGSDLPTTTLGSSVTITDAVNGKFNVHISDEETETAELGSGRWWIELHDAGDVLLLWRDAVDVNDP